ncbi:AtpZ/AtpI family protein [Labrenzia sp. PHM005]|uniref:AtpZ/AtpI family protein n=1 Tax=Labrenzia sp. PHM005 TaxID=2590016 RepID=UPI00113FF183|nr:AtpZ/AtpI family protein [Labrenzia sp. PHM005]QDG79088.1 ATP F0F1 synthase subunit I [Labrenzia sp. PHM005]
MSGSSQNGNSDDLDKAASEADLSERRDRLNRMLDGQRKADEAEQRVKKSDSSGYGQAMKLSSEFISGIVVGGGLGWFVDQWLGTTPFGLIVFLLIGFAAGVLNVMRAAGRIAEPEQRVKRDDAGDGGSN